MCCREGLDKPPKASTKANSGNVSAGRQPIKQATAGNRSKVPTASQRFPKGHGQSRKAAEIEKIDLTMGGKREVQTTLVPQTLKGLNRLHTNVQKSAPVGLISQKKPGFSYATGTQPSLSFLDEKAQGLEKFSSDYDDSWMDDLPSPSALVQNATPAAPRVPGDNGTAFDDSMSELEACMVGLDDSITLDNGNVDRAPSADPYGFQTSGDFDELDNGFDVNQFSSPKQSPTTKQAATRGPERSKSPAIFMSTDSLQKPESSPLGGNARGKRRMDITKGHAGLEKDGSTVKKRRVSGQSEMQVQDQHTVTDLEARMSPNHDLAEKPVAKSGWEGIDPALFAEYGDIVDIVEPE